MAEVLSAQEFLDRQVELEKAAAEALPDDIGRCSYSRGYVTQKVYSCLTCSRVEKRPHGVCYGCFVQCHTTHEVVELFSRRAFRCDCGTGKTCCGLQKASKGLPNDNNRYDRNFDNVFCWCGAEYDFESELKAENGTMLQCLLCEDWFHMRCMKNYLKEDSFQDFACSGCVDKHPFLKAYAGSDLVKLLPNGFPREEKPNKPSPEDVAEVKQTGKKRKMEEEGEEPGKKRKIEAVDEPDSNRVKVDEAKVDEVKVGEAKADEATVDVPKAEMLVVEDEGIGSSPNESPSRCKKPAAPPPVPPHVNFFGLDSWTTLLCECATCCASYGEHRDLLLGNEERYEPEPDEDAGKSLHDIGMKQLDRMDRVQALEGVAAYHAMAAGLKEFLRGFADEGKVVTEKDIVEFFAELKRKKVG